MTMGPERVMIHEAGFARRCVCIARDRRHSPTRQRSSHSIGGKGTLFEMHLYHNSLPLLSGVAH